jgi:Predicted ATP-grasp enzyme
MSEYIVFSGREHYNSLGIVRTLGEAGIAPIFIAVEGGLKFVGQSKYVKEKHYVKNVEDGVQLIIDRFKGDKSDKSFILVEDDWTVAALDEKYEELKDYFYFFNAQGNIKHFLDKSVQKELAIKYGLNVPKIWRVRVGEVPDDIEYPIITKAINSISEEWKDIVFICKNESELLEAYGKMRSKSILLQQYIEKVDEVSFDAFSIDLGKKSTIVLEAYQEYCISDKYSPYWKIQNYKNTDVGNRIKQIISEIGFEGIFEFEFLIDKDARLWFLEINLRNTALGYATTCAGMPQVILWCKSMKTGEIDEGYRVIIPDGFHAMAECFDYDARVKTGMISRIDWFKQFEASECKLYKGKDDDVPFSLFMHYKLDNM